MTWCLRGWVEQGHPAGVNGASSATLMLYAGHFEMRALLPCKQALASALGPPGTMTMSACCCTSDASSSSANRMSASLEGCTAQRSAGVAW